jgi:hypothetical protein
MRFPQSQTAHSPFGHDAAARLTSASLTGAPAAENPIMQRGLLRPTSQIVQQRFNGNEAIQANSGEMEIAYVFIIDLHIGDRRGCMMPILKEFGLTTNGDRSLVRSFELQTRCVTAHFERIFPEFRTESYWKVLVNCVSFDPRSGIRNLLGVCELDLKADVAEFLSRGNEEKKTWAYQRLRSGIHQLLVETNWDPEPFLSTLEQLQDKGLKNVWIWKSKWSPSRQWRAEIEIDHDVDSCIISLRIYDHAGVEIVRRQLVNEQPDEWAYSQHLGSLIWASKNTVSLSNKQKTHHWSINVLEARSGL